MNKKCICVLCHNYGNINSLIIKKLREDIQKSGNDTDLWLLYNIEDTNKRREQYNLFLEKGYNIWLFKFKDIQKKYPLNFFHPQHNAFYSIGLHDGNTHWPMLEFSQNLYYDYYMFYENDSIYTGNINQLYNQALQEKHDVYFLSQFFTNDKYSNWIWVNYAPSIIPQEYFYKCGNILYGHILNLYIFSYESCQKILENIIKYEWIGHHELLIPTICKFLNFDICFLQEKLNYCQQNYLQINIQNRIANLTKEQMKNSFFHPIKDLDTYNRII